ncbi:MAG: hypothetical protein ABUK01_17935 [Leptospirales bacterium]
MKKKLYIISFFLLALLGAAGLSLASSGELKGEIGGLYSSFSANFSYSSGSGVVRSGKIHYQYPGKVHIAFSDGRVIASNGFFLWIYSPSNRICAKQDLAGSGSVSGGIVGFLNSYEMTRTQNRFVFRKLGANIEEVTVDILPDSKMIKNLRFKTKNNVFTYSFSDIIVGAGVKASLFNYKPPTDAQMVENPLNRYSR